MSQLVSAILAGGTGTRLWPLSRTYYPKQFLKLDKNSLFQETYLRARKLSGPDRILVVTNEVHQYLVKNQIEELGYSLEDDQVLREPVGKNTLPAVTWAMTVAKTRFGNCSVAVFPSDHYLEDRALEEISGAGAITGEYLVTFGVVPTHPHTGYGYIARGEPLQVGSRVLEFREKPDAGTAAEYIRKGYLWNSGVFLFSTEVFFSELSRFQPKTFAAFQQQEIDYPSLESISVDYGLLERSGRVAVVPLSSEWTDLGTFRAWYEFREHDAQGNTGDAEYVDSMNNLVYAPDKKTALIGVSDIVVADTGDALL
ncbi:MAG: NTP transferase domain-containing protein, partial [Methanoregulaceae archaeon]|nr:NTP transferase domain-containing protein [Methanoregulaceae archaeon]